MIAEEVVAFWVAFLRPQASAAPLSACTSPHRKLHSVVTEELVLNQSAT